MDANRNNYEHEIFSEHIFEIPNYLESPKIGILSLQIDDVDDYDNEYQIFPIAYQVPTNETFVKIYLNDEELGIPAVAEKYKISQQ